MIRRAARRILVFFLFVHPLFARSADDAPRTVTVFEARQFSMPVPHGWTCEESRDADRGLQTLLLEAPGKEVILQVTFLPDPDGRVSKRSGLEAEARRILAPFLESSVERVIDLTFVDAPDGTSAYGKFTDGKLDPKHIPEDEKLISVTGLRSWKGAYALFTVLTNSTDSGAFKKALEIATSGLRQVKAPVAF